MTDYSSLFLGDLAAFLVGFAKSGVPGAGIMVVPLMALGFGAKPSVGLLLPMLIIGDAFAVVYYRRHAEWDKLFKVLPWIIPGIGIGYFALGRINDSALGPFLGILVLLMLGLEFARKKYNLNHVPQTWWFTAFAGCLAGFATTMGNAAGPIMTLYLLSMDMPKERFVGTNAWLFMIVNWIKVPLFLNLDMITTPSLEFNLAVAPAIAMGAVVGVLLLPKIPQETFNRIVIVVAALAAVRLLFS